MPVPIQLPDGVYDRSHVYQAGLNDRVSYERSFQQSPGEKAKIGAALEYASPATPQYIIMTNTTVPGVPPRFGYNTAPLTVDELFSRNLGHVNDFTPADFSGQQGGFSGTATPAIPPW